MKVASMEAFMESSVETSTKVACTETSIEIASAEASIEISYCESFPKLISCMLPRKLPWERRALSWMHVKAKPKKVSAEASVEASVTFHESSRRNSMEASVLPW